MVPNADIDAVLGRSFFDWIHSFGDLACAVAVAILARQQQTDPLYVCPYREDGRSIRQGTIRLYRDLQDSQKSTLETTMYAARQKPPTNVLAFQIPEWVSACRQSSDSQPKSCHGTIDALLVQCPASLATIPILV